MGDASQDGGVGNFVAVEVEDRQHRTIPDGLVPTYNAELSPAELMTLKQGLSFQTPTVIETWHRCQDGSVFPAEVSICRFGSEDNPREIAMARDITERKQAQGAIADLPYAQDRVLKVESTLPEAWIS